MAFENLRTIVESMGGTMRWVLRRMPLGGARVIVLGDWAGVFPYRKNGETTWFQDLNDPHDREWTTEPDAHKRLLAILEKTNPL